MNESCHTYEHMYDPSYGVPSINRMLKNIGLFAKCDSQWDRLYLVLDGSRETIQSGHYGVASINRMLKNIGLFSKYRSLL